MNSINIVGRLTQDPELKHTSTGKVFVSFTVAVKRSGNKDETDFIMCRAWEKRAEMLAQYFNKGRMIALEGTLRVDKYEKDGEKKSITYILINNVTFVDSKKDGESGSKPKTENTTTESHNNGGVGYDDEDEFPF